MALLGGNGAGESTLFRTIAGVIHPIQGSIELKGKSTHRLPANKTVSLGIGPLSRRTPSFPIDLPVYKNLMLGTCADRRDGAKEIQATLEIC